jgi:Mg-chelatase subunit ChlD
MTELNAAVMSAPSQLVQPRQQGDVFGQWPRHMAEEDASIQYANLDQQDPEEAKAAEQKTFSLRYTTQFQHVGSDAERAMLCMASITAPPVVLNRERSPLDLIAVVDRSGSMTGAKIALVQQALKYLLTQLTPRDRLSVISFDGTPNVLVSLFSSCLSLL